MSFSDYLASIDWLGAVVVATVMVGVGLVLLQFLTATTAEVGRMLPGARDAAGKKLLDARGEVSVDSWVCVTCRSVNTPQARYCYSGCGTRDDRARLLPEDRSVVAIGHNGRRNT